MEPLPRYSSASLIAFASRLLAAAGLEPEPAAAVARILVEADLMGHSTHGLQLLGGYLKELESGGMATGGEPELVSDHGACLAWDGRRLPGPWLVERAIDLGLERVGRYGTFSMTIRRSHHIACLAAYLRRVAEKGLVILLASSDPSVKSVAPFGGLEPLYTPDPLAAGIPTGGRPILIDISMSTTALGWVNRFKAEGRRMPGAWLMDNQGRATDDPNAVFTQPPGTILPLGGMDLGYKGFGLGLLIEALTAALSGFGRADQPTGWGAAVYLQLMDPAAFGGSQAFLRESGWLAQACLDNPPRPGVEAVRLPGQAALAKRDEQLAKGVELHSGIMPALAAWADKLKTARPAAL